MKYGTAGFRGDLNKIIAISEKIGEFIAYKVLYNNRNYGIMITGSHKLYLENGIKIIDWNGEMIDNEIEAYINGEKNIDSIPELNSPKKIYIGNDTRYSFFEIKSNIIKGIKKISLTIKIVDLNNVTTPQHHYITKYESSHLDYINKFTILKNLNIILKNITIDCANSVGFLPLENIIKNNKLDCNLVNTNIFKNELLNINCGSDYVMMNSKFPINCDDSNKFYFSIDGDCDKFLCYFKNQDELKLLDGDYISLLYLLGITNIIKKYNINNLTIGYIHTQTTNQAFLEWIKKLDIYISTVCTDPVTKNITKISQNYDICIYFELNGHGNIKFNNDKILKLKEFKEINELSNSIIGDGISGIFCVQYFLSYLEIDYYKWYNLLKKNKYLFYKKNIKNKNSYCTNTIGDRLIKSPEIQYKIEELKKKYKCVCHIIPSTTDENELKIYIESNYSYPCNLIEIKNKLDECIDYF